MTNIIGRIVLQPTIVRPGEPVRVEVLDNDDNPLNGSQTQVLINGVLGAEQFLQFPTVGQRRLIISVQAASGETDQQVALLDVIGAPLEFPSIDNRNDIAMLGVTQLPSQPYVAILTLGSSVDTRMPHLQSIEPSAPPLTSKGFAQDSLATRLATRGVLGRAMSLNPQALTRIETRRLSDTRVKVMEQPENGMRRTPRLATRRVVGAVYDLTDIDLSGIFGKVVTDPPLEFEWDFGDGNVATTHTPVISHDYFAGINHAAGVGQFVVTCNVKHAGITIKRTLTIHSAYAICKATGTVVPHVTADLFAHKRYNMLTGVFTIHNVEDTPIVLDRVSITPTTMEEDIALPKPYINLDQPITISAHSTSMVSVNLPFVKDNPQAGQLLFNVRGFDVLYAGKTGDLPVRCSATFDVPVAEWSKKPDLYLPDLPPIYRKPWPWELVEDALSAVVNPPDEAARPGYAVLDSKTGTLAVSLGSLQLAGSKMETRNEGLKVLATVYAPIETLAMEARRVVAPVARHLSGTIGRATPTITNATFDRKLIAPEFFGSVGRATSKTITTAAFDQKLSASGLFGADVHFLNGPPLPGPIIEGQVCDPYNLTEEELALADAGQIVCQLTNEVKDVLMPARWMRARKGDCILSPGGDGIIGGLMLNVEPAQWYSHCGIMTRNYDEITHSTGSQKRLMDHLIGFTADGSDGFEPSVLKYIWPGAVTQTVQRSIEGEDFPDPEYDKTYPISAFGPHTVGVTHNDQMKMIPPLVLKPDPMQETPAVRTALHAIATDAKNDAGRPGVKPKYHYRWYCYTDPTIALGAPEGPEAGWAAGTHPSVCSSYVWIHAKAQNTHLETSQALVTPTDLEPSDIDGGTIGEITVSGGAAVRPTTPDGLYTYSAKERSNAADWLFNTIHNQAFDKAGWFGEALTDGADDIANQFLNAFANDNADGKDSEEWKNATDADAVSPDNMIWWDGPALGGLYGFVEPAIYREPRMESYTVSKWKKVLSRGTVRGKVFGEAGSVAGAIVEVYDSKTAFSGADGSYTLNDVPLGKYNLKSSKVIDGVFYSTKVDIDLNVADMVVDIHLQPPADRFRIAQIFIDFWGRDEENLADDEIHDPGPEYYELELGPDKLVNSLGRTYKWGGEVRVEYAITVRLLVNNTIDVQVQGTLYEGTSENEDDNKDLDGQGGLTFQAGVGQTTGATLTITNTDEDDDDAGVLNISVKNVRNNN